MNENKDNKNLGLIIGVTACPTGIAHTYMAAESISKTASKMGYDVKIETNGSVGTQNELTPEDIKNAIAVIISADTKVDMPRFKGKRVYKTSVSQGIRAPKEILMKAINSPVYADNSDDSSESENRQQRNKTGFYSSLMNGVSNMLPLVVAGGILIAISFFWGINSANTSDPSYNKIAGMFMKIGGAAFSLFIPIMAGYIAYAIADRPGFAPGLVGGYLANTGGSGFLGGILAGFLAGYLILLLKRSLRKLPGSLDGLKPVLIYPLISVFIVGAVTVVIVNPIMGNINNLITHFLESTGTANKILLGIVIGVMLATDLGGPINKAAYLFSVGALSSGNTEIMGSAMCSGMVPSLATALAVTLSKDRFPKSQQEAAKANYVLGLSYIAEGAIPFAAADPIRVLPSLMIGSGIAGGLAMLFKVTSPAPHGGIFVLPIIGNPILFIASLVIGTFISALLIIILKKKLSLEEQKS